MSEEQARFACVSLPAVPAPANAPDRVRIDQGTFYPGSAFIRNDLRRIITTALVEQPSTINQCEREVGARETGPQNVTQLLVSWSRGNQEALAALMPLLYDELRRLARSHLRRERHPNTLQTSGLIHEAYLRLIGQRVNWKNRSHFFGIAAQMMRRVLVDHAKSQGRRKRGGGAVTVSLDQHQAATEVPNKQLVALDEALARLERVDPQRGRIVELRFFGGLSNEEASEVLGISTATVQRQWAGARAWLHHELSHGV